MPSSIRGCAMTEATLETPALDAVEGRSPGAIAFKRLRRNKAAMVSAVVLILITAFCFLGPYVNSHTYSAVYPSYVAVGPSLSPYPHEDTLEPVMKNAVERGRAKLDS